MNEKLVQFRQELHQIPELGYQEYKTKAYLLDHAKTLNCTIHEAGETGLVLFFDFGADSAIAFRADMDALPIQEQSLAPYVSKHPNVMHACGHDGHMAVLLGLAYELNQLPSPQKHNVVLVFQPAEEVEAGARIIVGSGLLERFGVTRIFGLHIWPGLEKGHVFTRPGPLLSRGSEVNVTVHGVAAHVASKGEGNDSLEAACSFIQDIYSRERSLPEETDRLLKFGKMESGTARNIVSDETHCLGTLRSFDERVHQFLKDQLGAAAAACEERFGTPVEIAYNDGYEAVINSQELYDSVVGSLPYVKHLPKPVMQSEDFSLYGHVCPSLFFFLGVGETPPLHNEAFDFDPEALGQGLRLFLDLFHLPQ